jgi:hypothetical protein
VEPTLDPFDGRELQAGAVGGDHPGHGSFGALNAGENRQAGPSDGEVPVPNSSKRATGVLSTRPVPRKRQLSSPRSSRLDLGHSSRNQK